MEERVPFRVSFDVVPMEDMDSDALRRMKPITNPDEFRDWMKDFLGDILNAAALGMHIQKLKVKVIEKKEDKKK